MTILLSEGSEATPLPPQDLPPASPPVQIIGMWDQEREHPWFYAALYAAAMLFGLLGHHVIGWLVQLFGGAA